MNFGVWLIVLILILDLTMHHTIEERHLFPILAEKMPQFSKNGDGAHILSHSGIHDGNFLRYQFANCFRRYLHYRFIELREAGWEVDRSAFRLFTYRNARMPGRLSGNSLSSSRWRGGWSYTLRFSVPIDQRKVADLRGENLVKYMTLADLEKIHI